MPTQCLGKTENVGIFPLCVSQGLNLLLQLWVHSLAGLAQPLVQGLAGALVGGDGPLLDVVQLVVPHELLSRRRWSCQGNATGSCNESFVRCPLFSYNNISGQ